MTRQVYIIEWLGVVSYISATSPARARRRAMISAQEAGYWRPGESLSGLKCRVAPYVPSNVAVMVKR